MKDFGVVGVIEAVLLIALFAIILSTFQLVYVPQIMKDREANHMDEVANQFYQMRFVLDLFTAGKINSSVSIPVTLGSREIPYLITSPASGEIYIVENIFTLKVNDSLGQHNVTIGGIRYDANNVYYERQSYCIEGGAIILEQPFTETLRIPPDLRCMLKGSSLEIHLTLVNITGYGSRIRASGYDTTYVRINYSTATSYNFYGVKGIVVKTSHPSAWHSFLNATINRTAACITKGKNHVEIEPKHGYTIDLYLDVVKVYAQVGLGWIGGVQ